MVVVSIVGRNDGRQAQRNEFLGEVHCALCSNFSLEGVLLFFFFLQFANFLLRAPNLCGRKLRASSLLESLS